MPGPLPSEPGTTTPQVSSFDAELEARRLTQQVEHLLEPAHRIALVERFCREREPEVVAQTLDVLVRRLLHGAEQDAWLAFAVTFAGQGLPYGVIGALYRVAVDAELDYVRMLLLGSDAPSRVAAASEFEPDDVLDALPLGERKSKARGNDRFLLDRLLFDADARVIEILLGNPRLTEADVVRIAAARPGRTEVLRTIVAAPRWIARSQVRSAVIQNPYTPVRTAIALSPLMTATDLRTLGRESSVHPAVRAAAWTLVRLRR